MKKCWRNNMKNPLFLGADPFILYWEGKYYVYPTAQVHGSENTLADMGYQVYVSEDLENWENKGFALSRDDVKGEKCFWAPEIIRYRDKFYMVYTSEEHLGVAVSDSPLGPFRQEEKKWLSENRAIDGHFFIDDDGQAYLYYVRLGGGNKICVTKMSDDLMSIDEENEKIIITAEEPWETVDARVTEGPFVLKHKGLYYLTYSANHTRSQDYAVGYATSSSPFGPFEKYEGNPILHKNDKIVGVGHHSFTKVGENKWICAYHSHFSTNQFRPRVTRLDYAEFVEDENGGKDILRVNGPTGEATL
ncbi:MAG: 1,4-beta-xylanase [Ruminococcaceae bacterium]|nr:1,4-beta-xylanase [Oscillospiraceae bacterium]